tara:strand:+ start:114 stop:455 length:342 start_codon:yes stop_codon:yes gene_type:complete
MPTRDKFLHKNRAIDKRQGSIPKRTIQRYRTVKYPEISLSARDVYITTSSIDRLDLLASQFYRDVDLWWIIATANPDVVRRDSLCLQPGIQIRIPLDVNVIIDDFERINKINT